ncbi:MAG: neutral/alkaline non-lysosomal ceramidase N-terminal domain-containing protein, partial [Armatimonadota bacterium]
MQEALTAGVAGVNITPSVGQDNMGDYARLRPAEGVGNELYAKALVLDDGATRAAFVTADVISFNDEIVSDVRSRIRRLTGIEGENVILSASHTHSSPATSANDKASGEYVLELTKKMAGAVYMADRNRREVRVGCGVGEAKVSINRWQRTATGVRWGPNPDAPVDPEVQVMRIDDVSGRPMAIVVNFACHPSIMGADNLLYSGDYSSYVQSVIERLYDGRATAMFCPGAGGDVKIAVVTEDGSQFRYTDLADCRKYGSVIAAEAIKVAEGIETEPVGHISCVAQRVALPLFRLPSVQDVERELEQLRGQGDALPERDRQRLRWAEETAQALKGGTAPRSVPVEVQLLRIGDEIAVFVVPGELFVEVGMKLKERMGLAGSFVVSFANAYAGYLPSKRAEEWGWCAHDSSYKWTGKPANFAGAIE